MPITQSNLICFFSNSLIACIHADSDKVLPVENFFGEVFSVSEGRSFSRDEIFLLSVFEITFRSFSGFLSKSFKFH